MIYKLDCQGYATTITSSGNLEEAKRLLGHVYMQRTRGRAMTLHNDKIVVVGYTDEFLYGGENTRLIVLDKDLRTLWYRTFLQLGNDSGWAVEVDDQGYIYIAGTVMVDDELDVFVAKYDMDGNRLWYNTLDIDGDDIPMDIIVRSDEYIYVVGYSMSESGDYDIAFIKLSKHGEFEFWVTSGTHDDEIICASTVDDQGYIYLAGLQRELDGDDADILILKYDENANVIWSLTLGGDGQDSCRDIVYSDGYIYIIGNTTSLGDGNSDVYIAKVTLDGNVVWERAWGSPHWEHGEALSIDEDKIFVTGYMFDGSQYDIILVAFNTSGQTLWSRSWDDGTLNMGLDIGIMDQTIYILGRRPKNMVMVLYNENGVPLKSLSWSENTYWTRTWGGGNADRAGSLMVYGDNLYVIGCTSSFDSGNENAFWLKLSLDGDIFDQVIFKSPYLDRFHKVYVYDDYVYICGFQYTASRGRDIMLLKYDLYGNLIKSNLWNWGWEWTTGITVYGGYIYVTGQKDNDAFLMKCTLDCDLVWIKTWGGSGCDIGIRVLGYGGYIYVAGYTQSYGSGGYDVVLLKFDTDGNCVSSYIWGGPKDDCSYGLAIDNGYIYISGETESFSSGEEDIFLIKCDTNGVIYWNKTWGGEETDWGMHVQILDGYIYVNGWTHSYSYNSSDLVILKYDAYGNLVWSSIWDVCRYEITHGLYAHSDALYMGCGVNGSFTYPYGHGEDACIIKHSRDMDGDGILDIAEQSIGTDIEDSDTDGDGITDGEEMYTYGTNPTKRDSDDDSMSDSAELDYGTDPLDPDTDSDGYEDGYEIECGTDPLDPNDYPRETGTTQEQEPVNMVLLMMIVGILIVLVVLLIIRIRR